MKFLTFSNVVAAVVVALLAPLPYWAILDREPAANSVSEILDSSVRQGDFLEISYRLEWRKNCKITAFRYIIDSMKVEWPVTPSERFVQPGRSEFVVRVPVPLAAAPGDATYRASLQFECNPLQRFWPLQQELKPREFKIVTGTNPATGLRQGRFVFDGVPYVPQLITYGGK